MIEIDTIQDIRQIETKLLGGFTIRQLISVAIGASLDGIVYLTTHSTPLILVISLIALIIGFFKKGNLTAIEYLKVWWDKQNQPRIRNYKNKNIIFEIEKQCKTYKSQKKKNKIK